MLRWQIQSGANRPIRFIAAVAVFALVAAACGGDDTSAGDDANGDAPPEGAYRIGYVASQTGWLALAEETFINGIRLAVETINESGGLDGRFEVELLIRDGKSDPAEGTIAAQELLGEDVDFFVLPCDQDPALGPARVAQEAGIPAISSCAGASTLPELAGDFVFLNTTGTYAEGTAMAHVSEVEGYETAYLLTSHDFAYYQILGEAFADRFENSAGQIVGTDLYTIGEARYQTQTDAIAALDPQPDVIAMSATQPEVVPLLTELGAAGVDTPIIGSSYFYDKLTLGVGAPLDDMNVVTPTNYYPKPGSRLEEFHQSYEAEYGSEPGTVFAGMAGDVIDLLDYAIGVAGSADPIAVRDALNEVEDLEVTTGLVTYKDQGRIPNKPWVALRATSSDFEVVLDDFWVEDVYQPPAE